jgi:hypothetical protein
MVVCSNLTVDKQFYLQKHIGLLYKHFCFVKYTTYENKILISMLDPERAGIFHKMSCFPYTSSLANAKTLKSLLIFAQLMNIIQFNVVQTQI